MSMSDLREYKCPACGGAIEFDSKSQKMKCPYCDTEFELETLKELDAQMEREAGQQEGETDGMNVYTCQSCGGEIIADENTGASNCPYCGNPVIMTEKFKGALRPDLVIPFKLDKKAAKEAYYRHIKGRTFLPKAFRRENHIDEIKGLYVPFWLFDGDVDADVRYKATKVRMWSDHDYDYTETSYYSVERSGEMTFVSVPVDGSEKMADDLMESIEPFKISESVDFQTAYLSGYLADKYDVSEKESINRAHDRMKKSAEEVLADTVKGYASVVPENTNVNISGGKAQYALYPVWILNTTWKDKKYIFAMNGQTGKMTERLADFADLLDDGQEEELEAKLDQVSEDYGCDVVVVTEETLDGAVPQDYADDFFDYNDYGMGEDKSGILFLITMSERKWCISTHGEAIQIFTDAGQEYMTDNFGSYLSDGEYYEGFMKFADLCEEFIIQAQSGEPYDVENLPKETIPFYMIFLISLVIGFVIALIVTGVMRSRMKTVRMKPDAADYMKDGSLHINRSRDIFLYHQVTRTAKPKEESSGGGGSSTHTSSSGETHGGSSGSF